MDNPDVPKWALELRHEVTMIRNDMARMREVNKKAIESLQQVTRLLDLVAPELAKLARVEG